MQNKYDNIPIITLQMRTTQATTRYIDMHILFFTSLHRKQHHHQPALAAPQTDKIRHAPCAPFM